MVGQFLVIGLGRFGRTVARTLARDGQAVLAADSNAELVQAIANEVDAVVVADATNEAALHELHPERASCAVIGIGMQSLEASILATALLKQAGVPRIVARAVSELHGRVLRAIGADEVVNPEAEMGERLAHRLAQPNVFERIELGDEVELAELTLPAAFAGRTLVELDVRRRYGLSIVALRRGERVQAGLSGDEMLTSGDVLIAIGTPQAIRKVAAMA